MIVVVVVVVCEERPILPGTSLKGAEPGSESELVFFSSHNCPNSSWPASHPRCEENPHLCD